MGRIRVLGIGALLPVIIVSGCILQRHLLKEIGECTCTEVVRFPEFRDAPIISGASLTQDLHCMPENQWLLWALTISDFIEKWLEQSSPIALYDVWILSVISLSLLVIPEIIILIKITVAVILYPLKYLWKLGFPRRHRRLLVNSQCANCTDDLSQTLESFGTSLTIGADNRQVICSNGDTHESERIGKAISDSDSHSSCEISNTNSSSCCNNSSNIINESNSNNSSPNFVECSESDLDLECESTRTASCNGMHDSEHGFNIDHSGTASQISTDHTISDTASVLSSQTASICKHGDKVDETMHGKCTMYTYLDEIERLNETNDILQFLRSASENCVSDESQNMDFGRYSAYGIKTDYLYPTITPGSSSESQSFSEEFHEEVDRIVVTSREHGSQSARFDPNSQTLSEKVAAMEASAKVGFAYNEASGTKKVISRSSIAIGDSLEMLVGELDFHKSESSKSSWENEQSNDTSHYVSPPFQGSPFKNGIVIINSKRDLEVSVVSIPSIDVSTAGAFASYGDTDESSLGQDEYSEEESSTGSLGESDLESDLNDSTYSHATDDTACDSDHCDTAECGVYNSDDIDIEISHCEYFDQDATGSWTESERITTQGTPSPSSRVDFGQFNDTVVRKYGNVGSNIQTSVVGGINDQTYDETGMGMNAQGASTIPTKMIKSALSMADAIYESGMHGKRHNSHRRNQTHSKHTRDEHTLLDSTRSSEELAQSSCISSSQCELAAVDNHVNRDSEPTCIAPERHYSDTATRLAAVKEKLQRLNQQSQKEQQREPDTNDDVEYLHPDDLSGKQLEGILQTPAVTANEENEKSETELYPLDADQGSYSSTVRICEPVLSDPHTTQEKTSFQSVPECDSSNPSPSTSKLEFLGLIGEKMVEGKSATKFYASAEDGQGKHYQIKKRWKSRRLREQLAQLTPATPIDTTQENNTQHARATLKTAQTMSLPLLPPSQTRCSEIQSHGDVCENKPESLTESEENDADGLNRSGYVQFMTEEKAYSRQRVEDGFPFCTGLLYPSIEERRAVFRRWKPEISQSRKHSQPE